MPDPDAFRSQTSQIDPATIIPPSLAADADTARQRLEAAGLDLTLAELARQHLEALAALGGAGSLLEAAHAFRVVHEGRNASKPLRDAVQAFLALKEAELRGTTLTGYRYVLERVLAPLADKLLVDVTTENLITLLEPYTPSTRKAHFRILRAGITWKSGQASPRKASAA